MRLEPVGERRVTKASPMPLWLVSKAPGVVGKSAERVHPTTVAAPCASRAMAPIVSEVAPPRNVDQVRLEPVGDSRRTNKSPELAPPLKLVSKAPGVVGKSP